MKKILNNWLERYFGDEHAIALLVCVVAVVVLAFLVGDIFIYFLVSLILAYLLRDLVNSLSRRTPRLLVALVVSFLLVGLMILALVFILPLFWSQFVLLVREGPGLAAQLLDSFRVYLERYITSEEISHFINAWSASLTEQVADWGRGLLSKSVTTLFSLVQILIYIFLVPLLVFFMLHSGGDYLRALGRNVVGKNLLFYKIWADMDVLLSNYVRGKVLEILIVGVTSYLLYLLFGLKYALLLAVLTGFSVLIPYVGAAVVTIPVLLLGFAQFGLEPKLVYLAIAYVVLQFLDGNVLVPILFSEAVSLHPLSILLAIIIFGGIWGFWGVFFAIPLATLIKTVVKAWPRSG